MVRGSRPGLLFKARFSGQRWVVAMTDLLWQQFCDVPDTANERLTAILEQLAKRGEADLPGRTFRWVNERGDHRASLAEIEARGVVLRGHVSPVEGRPQLFVTNITVDEAEEPVARARPRKSPDERQSMFKFDPPGEGQPRTEGEPK